MQFPLNIRFKLMALAPQIYVTDAAGRTVLYIKQKLFKLKEAVNVFSSEDQTQLLYQLSANKILDWSATYAITDATGRPLGATARKGMRSLWRISYTILNPAGEEVFSIREENAWIKVLDGLISDIAIVGMFSGYFLHPTYLISRPDGQVVMRAKKQSAFFEGKFAIDQHAELTEDEQMLCTLSTMMMLLMEKNRG